MLKFIQTHSEARDCTALYDVILDKPYTAGEFVEKVLVTRSNEWGNFDVMGRGSDYFHPTARVKYRYGKLLETLPENLLSMQIERIKAHGGWTNMDYQLYITE